jgi:Tol biopolymer transport system component
MLKAINFKLSIIILQCALLCIVIAQQVIATPFAYSTSNSTQTSRLNGPISSIQFSSDGDVLWIVSGRWRMEGNFDNAGIAPMVVKGLNVSLVVVPADGSRTDRYQLSDFKQDSISYDNNTVTSSAKGKLTMTIKDQRVENIDAELKLTNKNILAITLDPAKTRDQLGETPIYGIER